MSGCDDADLRCSFHSSLYGPHAQAWADWVTNCSQRRQMAYRSSLRHGECIVLHTDEIRRGEVLGLQQPAANDCRSFEDRQCREVIVTRGKPLYYHSTACALFSPPKKKGAKHNACFLIFQAIGKRTNFKCWCQGCLAGDRLDIEISSRARLIKCKRFQGGHIDDGLGSWQR